MVLNTQTFTSLKVQLKLKEKTMSFTPLPNIWYKSMRLVSLKKKNKKKKPYQVLTKSAQKTRT